MIFSYHSGKERLGKKVGDYWGRRGLLSMVCQRSSRAEMLDEADEFGVRDVGRDVFSRQRWT